MRVAAAGVKIGSEVTEEELQLFLEPLYRTLVMGEDYSVPAMEEILYTVLLTAITTGMLEGGDIASYSSKDINALLEQAKEQIKEDGEKALQSGNMPDDAHLEIMELNEPTARGMMVIYHMVNMEQNDALNPIESAENQDVESDVQLVDTGEMEVVETKPVQTANDEWMSRGYDKAPYNPSYEVKVVRAGNEKFVRVFSYNEDGTSNKLGYWLMRKSDIEGLTPLEIADKFALPKVPTHICDVIVDPDFVLQTGIANPVEGWGDGGGQQFDTMGVRLPRTAFINERLIGE